jgi:hypothetical protein
MNDMLHRINNFCNTFLDQDWLEDFGKRSKTFPVEKLSSDQRRNRGFLRYCRDWSGIYG